MSLFEGGTPGCQWSLTPKQSKVFLLPQAPRFMLTSSQCDMGSKNETGRAKAYLYFQFSHNL